MFLAVLFVLLAAPFAHAQVRVDLGVNRPLYIRFEPLIVTVTVTNLSGRELELADDGNHKWLSFQIEYVERNAVRIVPPYNSDYQLTPVQIGPGQSIKRMINMTPIYPMTEFGLYRIRATIYAREFGQYFSSNPPMNIEISEGRTLWQQEVGVPTEATGGSTTRTLTLLAHRLPKNTQLYLRIEDKENGVVYCTHQLGRLLAFGEPDVEFDADNNVHILHYIAPKSFMYTSVGLDGRVLDRKQYDTVKAKPSLRRDPAGMVQVVGGFVVDPNAVATSQAAAPPASVSDRPVPLPTPED